MSDRPLRVAFFPDTFDEIDGVANTSRQFEAFARRRALPFLTVHGGPEAAAHSHGSTERLTLPRGSMGFALDKHHGFDLAFLRYLGQIEAKVEAFNADIVHITGPSDAGLLGMLIAHRLGIPLAASWHTNLHQYAEQRSAALREMLPPSMREAMGSAIRGASLFALMRFYSIGQVLFAPNTELCHLLERGTNKSTLLMQRGVDTELFHPRRRTRNDDAFVIGFVGRLSPEKSVRELADLERSLLQAGARHLRFVVVGQGAEEEWLRENMQHAELPGVLRGEALAETFANMDAFVFPSRTDTFGNVVLEALASGVPSIVTDSGGPRFLVRDGETGYVTRSTVELAARVLQLAQDPALRERMALAAREHALKASWDAVFEQVYAAYEQGLRDAAHHGKRVRAKMRRGVVVSQAG
jgi:glycosyltransferase involved in cell wall biosynthesis